MTVDIQHNIQHQAVGLNEQDIPASMNLTVAVALVIALLRLPPFLLRGPLQVILDFLLENSFRLPHCWLKGLTL